MAIPMMTLINRISTWVLLASLPLKLSMNSTVDAKTFDVVAADLVVDLAFIVAVVNVDIVVELLLTAARVVFGLLSFCVLLAKMGKVTLDFVVTSGHSGHVLQVSQVHLSSQLCAWPTHQESHPSAVLLCIVVVKVVEAVDTSPVVLLFANVPLVLDAVEAVDNPRVVAVVLTVVLLCIDVVGTH